jgi:PIN domain nuclease of toxin-antitoxin system
MRFKAGLERLPEPALPMLQYERSVLGLQSLPLHEDCLVQLSELDDLRFNAFDQVLICQALHHKMRLLTDRPIFQALSIDVMM